MYKAVEIVLFDAVHIYKDQTANPHASHSLGRECTDTSKPDDSDS